MSEEKGSSGDEVDPFPSLTDKVPVFPWVLSASRCPQVSMSKGPNHPQPIGHLSMSGRATRSGRL